MLETLHPSVYHKVCHLFAITQAVEPGYCIFNKCPIGGLASTFTFASKKLPPGPISAALLRMLKELMEASGIQFKFCLLYTSDAADE